MLLCLAYYTALQLSYALVESRLYESMGLVYDPPGLTFLVISAAMAILPAFALPITVWRPSQVCLWVIYLSVFVPMCFIPFHVLDRPPQEVLWLPLSLLASFVALLATQRIAPPLLPRPSTDPRAATILLHLCLVGLIAFVWRVQGSLSLDLSLDDVYYRRMQARDAVAGGSLMAYAMSTLTYSISPIALLWGYLRRHYVLMAVSVLAFLVVFSTRATKTDLFMPLFLFGICVSLLKANTDFGLLAPISALAVTLLSIGEYVGLGTDTLSGYLIRRQIMVPPLLTSFYWDFFVDQPLMMYSDRFYGSFFVTPRYDMPLTRLIGYEYFGNSEMNANTCFWGSAFANLGYFGVALVTALLGLLLRLFDGVAECGQRALCASMAGLLGVQLTNGALESCLITGGVGLSLVVLYGLAGERQEALRSTVPTTGANASKAAA